MYNIYVPPVPLRTLVIENNALSCSKFKAILFKHHYRDVDVATNITTGFQMAEQHQPDVIAVNVSLLKNAGLRVIFDFEKILPNVIILMISDIDGGNNLTRELLTNAIKYGASGFIFKPFYADSIKRAMENAMEKIHANHVATTSEMLINKRIVNNGVRFLNG